MARSRVWCTALLPAILCAQQTASDEIRVSSRAYVAPPSYSLRVETKLVELNVGVRDGKGRAIRGLKREDFHILDEGKEREIAAFSEETAAGVPIVEAAAPAPATVAVPDNRAFAAPAPPALPRARYLALYIDDVNAKDYAAGADLGRTQTAAKKFVTEALVPGALIGLFTTSGTVSLDFTNDAAKLTAAIAHIKPHQRMSEIGLQYCPRVTPYRAYQIVQLHDRQLIRLIVSETGPAPNGYNCAASRDQVLAEAEETWRQMRAISIDTLASIDRVVGYLGTRPGARVLVMASSGFFGQTLEQQQQALIDHAIRSGVVINALDSKGMYAEPPPGCRSTDPDPSKCVASDPGIQYETMALSDRLMMVNSTMADLAHGTGGEFFHNNSDLHAGLRQLGVPPEVTYRIAFRPDGVPADGKYRKLKVQVAHAGNYSVDARPGYFAPENPPADDPRTKLDREVAASDELDDFPGTLAIEAGKPDGGRKTLSIIVRVDVTKLQFAAQDGRKKQRIAFVSAVLDAQGKTVAAKEGWMDLALTPETYDRLAKTGLNAELSFQLAPGVYGLREVMQEAVEGKLSAVTRPVDLR